MAETAQGWRPSEGDTVRGKVVEMDKAWSDYTSSWYPIITLRTDNGDVAVHCFHAVLRNRLRSLKPKVGDTLEITYSGKRTSKDGKREVSQYAVSTDATRDQEGFWDDIPGGARSTTPSGVEDDIPF